MLLVKFPFFIEDRHVGDHDVEVVDNDDWHEPIYPYTYQVDGVWYQRCAHRPPDGVVGAMLSCYRNFGMSRF